MEDNIINNKTNGPTAPFLINAKSEPQNFSGKYLDLEWRNLNVDIVDSKAEKCKTILKKCTGYVKHGHMLAIMGPSGFFI